MEAETNIRTIALHAALGFVHSAGFDTAEQVVKAAAVFETFLRGEAPPSSDAA